MRCVKLSLRTMPFYHSNEGRLRANTFQPADPQVMASLTGGPCAVFFKFKPSSDAWNGRAKYKVKMKYILHVPRNGCISFLGWLLIRNS